MTPHTRRAFAALALWLAAGGASAEEWIRDFRSDLRLHEDGSFTVEERIVYEFGDAQRHGIYRDIPVRYGRGNAPNYRIALEVVSVTDAGGRARRTRACAPLPQPVRTRAHAPAPSRRSARRVAGRCQSRSRRACGRT